MIENLEKLCLAVSSREPANDGVAAPSVDIDDHLDRLLGSLVMVPAGAAGPQEQPVWSPPVAILETAHQLLICIDLPGVPAEQLTVTATPLLVTVTGRDAALQTRGAFRRDVALPPGVLVDDLTATFKEGVLELRMPCARNLT